jgi:hypothetical protein
MIFHESICRIVSDCRIDVIRVSLEACLEGLWLEVAELRTYQ